MKSGKKALLLALCAVLLVAATVMGTMAYLTATSDTVENTFTFGHIAIRLDETQVDSNGVEVKDGPRVTSNTYKLMPGHEYIKDPTVHVFAGSEDSYIFVKVDNGISAFEAATSIEEGGYKTIADQITANDWTALIGVDGVYYKTYASASTDTDYLVFGNFKIADDANRSRSWDSGTAAPKVTVTAYAVQKDGFANANAAWDATFGAQTSGT